MYYKANARHETPATRIVLIVGAALLAAVIGWTIAACGTTDQAGTTDATTSPVGPGADEEPEGAGNGMGGGNPGNGGGNGDHAAGGNNGNSGDGDHGEGGQPPGPDGNGGNDGNDGNDGGGEAVVEPSPKDCVSYHPANLAVKSAGGTGWLMIDGGHSMALFDTKADAEDGVKVARNYTRSCFIGRGNQRPDRERYIVRYWEKPSGLPLGLAPKLDCVSYHPANLTVEKYGEAGWRLVDGEHAMLLLDTQADAERAKLVASAKSRLCFIGRGNDRPDRYRYIVEFWLD
jgi:hypothetical protein